MATFVPKALLAQIFGFRIWLSSLVEQRQKHLTPSIIGTELQRDALNRRHVTQLPDTTLDSRAALEIAR